MTDDAQRVVLRLRCLYAQFVRAWAEAKHRKDKQAAKLWSLPERELFELANESLLDRSLRASFTTREKETIRAPLGRLAIWRIAEGIYRAEAVELLAWALSGTALAQRWDRGAKFTYMVLKPDQMFGGRLPHFLASPKLRRRSELIGQRDYEQLWAWRFRMEGVQLTIGLASTPDGFERVPGIEELFSKQVARRAKEGAAKRWLKPIRSDFPVGRRTFAAAFQKSIIPRRDFAPYANERLRAINWVLKPAQAWHRTSTATPLGFVLPRRMIGEAWFLKRYLDPRDDQHWYW